MNSRFAILALAVFLALPSVSMVAQQLAGSDVTPGETAHASFFALGPLASEIKASDLTVLDHKKPPRSILAVRAGQEVPLRLALVIDNSGSQKTHPLYPAAMHEASELLKRVLSAPEDKGLIVDFADTIEATAFLDRTALLDYRIVLRPKGRTALYDAVRFTCDERFKKDAPEPARRVIIVISDGGENRSRADFARAIRSALEAGVVIFTVSTFQEAHGGYIETLGGNFILQRLADETGGQAFEDLGEKELPRVFATIEEQMKHMYTLSYVPADAGDRHHFHSIQIKSADRRVKIRTARGYYRK